MKKANSPFRISVLALLTAALLLPGLPFLRKDQADHTRPGGNR